MGVHLQLAAMSKSEHTRQANIFPLTPGPRGSNFHEVIQVAEPLQMLDRGLTWKIKGKSCPACAPIMALTGDMLHQNEDSDCLDVLPTVAAATALFLRLIVVT